MFLIYSKGLFLFVFMFFLQMDDFLKKYDED